MIVFSFIQLACSLVILAIFAVKRGRKRHAEVTLSESALSAYLDDIYATMHGIESTLYEIRDTVQSK